jgi:methylase of polypeptide subunit release factors
VTSGPLEVGDPAAIAELGTTLSAAGFSGEGVRAALGSAGELLARSVDIPLYERRLAGVEPLGTIVKLLVLDATVPADDARRAFAPLPLEGVEALGVVETGGGEARARVRVVPHDELLIASDRRGQGEGDSRPDHVAGVHGPSLTLSHLTVRRPVETALDVGTGGGIQAILAARHSGRVVATDVNARALNFAAFNTHLNGVDNVELRLGSFFEPVEDERFGLVTCNPPYVISPESEFLFRDSGLSGDTVSRDVVRRAREFLEEGAFAQMLVSWVDPPGGDWSATLRSWLEGSGCDAWLLHHGTDDPLTHAGKWLRPELGSDSRAYAAALDRWLEYFRQLGIEGIASGAVILRRRSGANWLRTDELSGDRLRPAGEQILRVFAAGNFLSAMADERELLGERLVLAADALLEQQVVFRDREWTVEEIELTLQEGLRFRAGLDQPTAALLAALDGKRTLGEVADDLARLQGASRESVAQAVLSVATGMLGAGFLERLA